ncbi:MAG: indole-3-glycerol phosphate synthase TrpC, partial [Campylobacter sp.]
MILDEILERTKIDLERKKTRVSFDELGRTLSANPFMPRDVKNALKSSIDEPIRIIAEVKKASPSKGIIRENLDPIQIAIEYEKGGANAFSVVTEPHFFKGNLDYISFIRRYTNTPILRKDFIIDRYQ